MKKNFYSMLQVYDPLEVVSLSMVLLQARIAVMDDDMKESVFIR